MQPGATKRHAVTVSYDATVAQLITELGKRLTGPVTLVHAGRKLVCPTDRLDELGIKDGMAVNCLKKETGAGPSVAASGPF
eukprot:904536-Prymnesium_polylepis.1